MPLQVYSPSFHRRPPGHLLTLHLVQEPTEDLWTN
jgi:hypothetical protein